ncbi:hypothetical protein CW304_07165 [Bacillus sp. UFRGS-B20]|nr:hypothetical protein CW304_07165 [Bacillus sp. UFRGS-B20]
MIHLFSCPDPYCSNVLVITLFSILLWWCWVSPYLWPVVGFSPPTVACRWIPTSFFISFSRNQCILVKFIFSDVHI